MRASQNSIDGCRRPDKKRRRQHRAHEPPGPQAQVEDPHGGRIDAGVRIELEKLADARGHGQAVPARRRRVTGFSNRPLA